MSDAAQGPDYREERPGPERGAFATTRWSVVLSAGDRSSPAADSAIEYLFRTYWYPLYAYARRRGCRVDDAQDLTQEFFALLIDRQFLQTADRERGRFRSFLLTVFKRFLSREHERQHAKKRGGGVVHWSIDVTAGEARYGAEPADPWTPETLFERRWALTLLERVLTRLEEDYAERGKSALFEQCRPCLAGTDQTLAYAEIAERLAMTESAVRVAVHRMRQRYRELLKSEVAQTVAHPDDVEAELRDLRSALRGEKSS